MRLSLTDLSALSRPLLVLALVIGAAIAGVMFAERSLERTRVTLAKARTELTEAQKRVQRSGEERDTIQRFLGPYFELAQRGVLGEERRLAWVDALRSANAETKLYGVDYEVGARQAYAYPSEVNAGSLSVQQSVMKLKFGLLYEQDLLDFFTALARQQAGAFALNQCALQRLVDETARPANAPTLRAECEVAWITIPMESGS